METTLTSSTNTRSTYPSIREGWILVAVLIGWQLVLSIPFGIPMYFAKENGIDLYGIPELLVYVLTFWFTIRYAQKRRDTKALAFGAVKPVIFPLVAIGTVALAMLTEPLISAFPTPDWLAKLMKSMFTKSLIISAVIAAPFLEEILLRGIVLDGFLKQYAPAKAIVWSAVLFGVMHLIPVQVVNAFVLGLALGWLYYRTGSLWPGICLHFVNNALSSLGFFLFDTDKLDMGANTTRAFVGNDTTYFMVLAICAVIVVGCYVLLDRIMPKREIV
jgi:uncharacterized protein